MKLVSLRKNLSDPDVQMSFRSLFRFNSTYVTLFWERDYGIVTQDCYRVGRILFSSVHRIVTESSRTILYGVEHFGVGFINPCLSSLPLDVKIQPSLILVASKSLTKYVINIQILYIFLHLQTINLRLIGIFTINST